MNSIVRIIQKISSFAVLLCMCKITPEVITINNKEHFKRCLKTNSDIKLAHKEQVNSALISNVAVINQAHDFSGNNADINLIDDHTAERSDPVNPYTAPLIPKLPPEVEAAEPFIEKTPAFTPTLTSNNQPAPQEHLPPNSTSWYGFFTPITTSLKNGALYIQETVTHAFTRS